MNWVVDVLEDAFEWHPVSDEQLEEWRFHAINLQLGEIVGVEIWPQIADPDSMLARLTTHLQLNAIPHRVESDDSGRVWVEMPGQHGWERITRKVGELVE